MPHDFPGFKGYKVSEKEKVYLVRDSSKSLLHTFACAPNTLKVFMIWTADTMKTRGHPAAYSAPLEAKKHQGEHEMEGLHVGCEYFDATGQGCKSFGI